MTPLQNEVINWCIVCAIICATALLAWVSWQVIGGSFVGDSSGNADDTQLAKPADEVPPAVEDKIDRSLPRSADDPRPMTLDGYSDEEKNRIWWEIASVANVRGELTRSYSLTFSAATPVAIKYAVTEMDVLVFFRKGARSAWRSDEPPRGLGASDQPVGQLTAK